MENTSQLTDKILAFREVPDYDINEVITWSLEMLELGYETPSLLILAGLSKNDNHFEKVKYLEKSCYELNLSFRTGDTGIISYSTFFIKQLAQGIQVKQNLASVYAFCQAKDYTETIYDFYLLHWAWDDFAYGDKYTDYWSEATPQTIEAIAINTSIKWLANNRLLQK